ncbi:MAG: protein arginine kinase [Candidatus Omnitrophica bacterium]|nr:protein arginine kinase [Candidatus Omnitrophota bacterium]MDD5487654.1 protein arginine kinase [Candidatus Omnitrophota bacterium]
MKLDTMLKRGSEWLRGEGPGSDIAISTRIRLARNVKGEVYFTRAGADQREAILNKMMGAMKKSAFLSNSLFLKMRDISPLERDFLVERHLISREHVMNAESKGLVVDDKEITSIMLNEEDHIRMQVLKSGFDLMEAWRIADEIDNDLGKYIPFDFSAKYGYLTSCPTNTGTGLRASVMLHLSGLVMTGQIENVFDAISKLGMTIRGFYGEGTEALGDFFQISNQVALGYSEMGILGNLERVIKKIVEKERETREALIKNKKNELTEKINLSYSTLKDVRIITSREAIKLLSAVRLGMDLGIIKGIGPSEINGILVYAQPAHLQMMNDDKIEPFERDIKRADFVRMKLSEK